MFNILYLSKYHLSVKLHNNWKGQCERGTWGRQQVTFSTCLDSFGGVKPQTFVKLYVIFSWLPSIKGLSFLFLPLPPLEVRCGCRVFVDVKRMPDLVTIQYLVTDSRSDICVTSRSVTPAYISITPAPCASSINQSRS